MGKMKNGKTLIPSKCEVIRKLGKLKELDTDAVVCAEQLQEDVLVGNCIVNKNYPFIKIINTSNKAKLVIISHIKTIPLNEFEIVKTSNHKDENRLAIKKNLIRKESISEDTDTFFEQLLLS